MQLVPDLIKNSVEVLMCATVRKKFDGMTSIRKYQEMGYNETMTIER
jgi:hypothetical protein